MKMPKVTFGRLEAAMTAVADHRGKDACRAYAEEFNHERMRWSLFFAADHNLRYGDDHPFFANGLWDRVYPQCADWHPFTDLNDNHIDTALRAITKKLGV